MTNTTINELLNRIKTVGTAAGQVVMTTIAGALLLYLAAQSVSAAETNQTSPQRKQAIAQSQNENLPTERDLCRIVAEGVTKNNYSFAVVPAFDNGNYAPRKNDRLVPYPTESGIIIEKIIYGSPIDVTKYMSNAVSSFLRRYAKEQGFRYIDIRAHLVSQDHFLGKKQSKPLMEELRYTLIVDDRGKRREITLPGCYFKGKLELYPYGNPHLKQQVPN